MDGWMDGGSLEDNKWKVNCSICNHDQNNNNITCLLRLLIVIHAHGEGKGHWMFSSMVWTLHKTIDEKLPTIVATTHLHTMMDGWMLGGLLLSTKHPLDPFCPTWWTLFQDIETQRPLKMALHINSIPIQSNPIPSPIHIQIINLTLGLAN